MLHSYVTYERLDLIFEKYHLIEEYGIIPPGPIEIIDRPPLGKIAFYLYYYETGLNVPPSSFFELIVKAYKIHTC